jgi:hypothetical protein
MGATEPTDPMGPMGEPDASTPGHAMDASEALYERPFALGAIVRVRRVSVAGISPVRAVLEVDRRGGELRPGQTPGHPPALYEVTAATERDVLAELLPLALEDAEIARLMRDRGIR